MLEKRFGPVNLDLLDIASRQLNWLLWEYAEARRLLYWIFKGYKIEQEENEEDIDFLEEW